MENLDEEPTENDFEEDSDFGVNSVPFLFTACF